MSVKIIQFQIFEIVDKDRGLRYNAIYGLGDDGVVYWYDTNTRLWISKTRNEFMAEGK